VSTSPPEGNGGHLSDDGRTAHATSRARSSQRPLPDLSSKSQTVPGTADSECGRPAPTKKWQPMVSFASSQRNASPLGRTVALALGSRDWADQMVLAADLKARSSEAHSYAFRIYASAVRASSRQVLKSEQQVEDVVQLIFSDLWVRPERFDPARGTLVAYVKMQARARSIDLVRSEARRLERERHVDHGAFRLPPSLDPPEYAVNADKNHRVQKHLGNLPEGERRAIELAFFGHLTYSQVADRLGLPEGTVKSQIRRGLSRLRKVLEDGNAELSSPDLSESA
jgi:RNA polymerase sigma-70 factor (ECF subfamily)